MANWCALCEAPGGHAAWCPAGRMERLQAAAQNVVRAWRDNLRPEVVNYHVSLLEAELPPSMMVSNVVDNTMNAVLETSIPVTEKFVAEMEADARAVLGDTPDALLRQGLEERLQP